MAESPLVDAGKKLIEKLDEANVDLRSAFWIREPEAEDWSLILATTIAGADGAKAAYAELLKVFRENEEALEGLMADDLVSMDPQDPLFAAHLQVFGRIEGISTVRSSGNVVNGHVLPATLIYRLQPAVQDRSVAS